MRSACLSKFTQPLIAGILACSILFCNNLSAQKQTVQSPLNCTLTINSFPYTEKFESSDGSWVPGGILPDWAWGIPSKAVITAAGEGAKCWLTGGLSSSAYMAGENSWLESPCFNFTSLLIPQIKFKVFWETEKKYDGASVVYSIDGGVSWLLLGSINSNSNCQGQNWYNTSPVTYLGNTPGWSGNIQPNAGSCLGGGGSAGWLTATHDLSMLAGKPSVKFRFLFGAGTTCNDFNGFAIDDIQIAQTPAQTSSFSSTCVNDSSVSFVATTPCGSNVSWNFNDPLSGSSNISSMANVTHTFSGPGTYNVVLNVQYANGQTSASNKQIVILGLRGTENWPGKCSGTANATLTAIATGSNTTYFYSWDTSPVQATAAISNVGAGTYKVTVTSANACPRSLSFTLPASSPILINPIVTSAYCGNSNGKIISNPSGGVTPYNYVWSNGSAAANITGLAAGIYTLQVTDASGCTASSGNIVVANTIQQVIPGLGADAEICSGVTLTLQPGNFATYQWQDNSTGKSFTVKLPGKYFVKVTDSVGCTGSDTVLVKENCTDVFFPGAFTPNDDTKNDAFGPLGNLAGIKNYQLRIYNRYGQIIFSSSNPYEKWDGKFRGEKLNSQSFTWIAVFDLNNKNTLRKGMLILLR